MSPRPDVSEARRPQILEAATRVFTRKGFDAARMEDIAKEAHLSVGGVYWYYASKEQLILALMDALIDLDLHDLRSQLDAPGPVLVRLERYLQNCVPGAQHLLPLTYELYSQAGRQAVIRRHLQKYFSAYQGVMEAFIRQGVDRGEFRPVDVPSTATAIMAIYEGVLEMTWLAPRLVEAGTVLRQSMHLLMTGLARGAGAE